MPPQDSQQPPKNKEFELPPEVATAIIQGYYSRGVAAADRSRDRADKGYTIASAIAAALVAAGVFTHLDERALSVQVAGLVALGLWLAAALLFIWVVSLPVHDESAGEWHSPVEFAKGVSEQVTHEVNTLRFRLWWAVGVTVAATAVTVAALTLATTLPAPSAAEQERVVLTKNGDADVARLCTHRVGDIWAWVDPRTLKDAIVSLVLPAKECNPGKTTIRIPKADISATEKVPYFPRFPS